MPPGCSDTRDSEWQVSPTWYWLTSSSFFDAPLNFFSSQNDFAPDGSFSMLADASAGNRATNMFPNLSVPAIVS